VDGVETGTKGMVWVCFKMLTIDKMKNQTLVEEDNWRRFDLFLGMRFPVSLRLLPFDFFCCIYCKALH